MSRATPPRRVPPIVIPASKLTTLRSPRPRVAGPKTVRPIGPYTSKIRTAPAPRPPGKQHPVKRNTVERHRGHRDNDSMAAADIRMPEETMTRMEAAYHPLQEPAYNIPHSHDQAGQSLATQEAHKSHYYTPLAEGAMGYNAEQEVDHHSGHTKNNNIGLEELGPEHQKQLEWALRAEARWWFGVITALLLALSIYRLYICTQVFPWVYWTTQWLAYLTVSTVCAVIASLTCFISLWVHQIPRWPLSTLINVRMIWLTCISISIGVSLLMILSIQAEGQDNIVLWGVFCGTFVIDLIVATSLWIAEFPFLDLLDLQELGEPITGDKLPQKDLEIGKG